MTLVKTLKSANVPIVEDKSFYNAVDSKSDYVVVGHFNEQRIKRLHNKIMNGVCVRNKRLFTVVNKALRGFYKGRKVLGSRKIKIIPAPDKYFSIRLVNGGFKLTRPYVLKNKLLLKNKKGLKDLQSRISDYVAEFSKFKSYLSGKFKSASGKSGSGVRGCGLAIVGMTKKLGTRIIKAHYDNDPSSYPMLELSVEPTQQELKTLEKLFNVSKQRNDKLQVKVSKLLMGHPSKYIDVSNFFSCDPLNYKAWPLGLFAISQ